MDFVCVQPIESHANLIRTWRNDPQSLKMSFTYTEPKSLQQFYPEFLKNYFSHPTLSSLFAMMNGEKIGVVRFDPACEISLLIAPEFRGQGFGTKVLLALLPLLERLGVHAIDAKIKKENGASLKTFTNAGYSLKEELPGYFLYRKELSNGRGNSVFIIAEAGSNWKAGSFEEDCKRAFELVEAAKAAGADAVKFQTFKRAKTYVADPGKSDYLSQGGVDRDIGELFSELEMPVKLLSLLAKHCASLEIELMSSFFSPEDFEEVNPFVKRHKIASYEISYPALLRLAADSGKPLILSTGAASPSDIDWAVDTFRNAGGKDLTLMQCTACYPAPPHAMNLLVLPWLKKRYQVQIGLSDHSLEPLTAPLAAYALGARVIEKHFTLDRLLKGPDHSFSIEPRELSLLVSSLRHLEKMLGDGEKKIEAAEEELYFFARRGIQALKNILPGEILRLEENIAILRPGKRSLGDHPRFLQEIEGKEALKEIPKGEGVKREDVTP